MKKRILLSLAILTLLALTACNSTSSGSTANADPYAAMAITDEQYTCLLALWPLDEAIASQGTITSYSASQQYGVDMLSLNAQFTSTDSTEKLYKKYKALISGDWEDSKYSIGPTVYSGKISDTVTATCQIARSGSPTEVFLGVSTQDSSNTVTDTVLAHWPAELIPVYTEMTDENQFFNTIKIEPAGTLSLSRSWSITDIPAAMTFYSEQLAEYDSFAYDAGDEYASPSITCKAKGITINISASSEIGTVEITYTRPYAED